MYTNKFEVLAALTDKTKKAALIETIKEKNKKPTLEKSKGKKPKDVPTTSATSATPSKKSTVAVAAKSNDAPSSLKEAATLNRRLTEEKRVKEEEIRVAEEARIAADKAVAEAKAAEDAESKATNAAEVADIIAVPTVSEANVGDEKKEVVDSVMPAPVNNELKPPVVTKSLADFEKERKANHFIIGTRVPRKAEADGVKGLEKVVSDDDHRDFAVKKAPKVVTSTNSFLRNSSSPAPNKKTAHKVKAEVLNFNDFAAKQAAIRSTGRSRGGAGGRSGYRREEIKSTKTPNTEDATAFPAL